MSSKQVRIDILFTSIIFVILALAVPYPVYGQDYPSSVEFTALGCHLNVYFDPDSGYFDRTEVKLVITASGSFDGYYLSIKIGHSSLYQEDESFNAILGEPDVLLFSYNSSYSYERVMTAPDGDFGAISLSSFYWCYWVDGDLEFGEEDVHIETFYTRRLSFPFAGILIPLFVIMAVILLFYPTTSSKTVRKWRRGKIHNLDSDIALLSEKLSAHLSCNRDLPGAYTLMIKKLATLESEFAVLVERENVLIPVLSCLDSIRNNAVYIKVSSSLSKATRKREYLPPGKEEQLLRFKSALNSFDFKDLQDPEDWLLAYQTCNAFTGKTGGNEQFASSDTRLISNLVSSIIAYQDATSRFEHIQGNIRDHVTGIKQQKQQLQNEIDSIHANIDSIIQSDRKTLRKRISRAKKMLEELENDRQWLLSHPVEGGKMKELCKSIDELNDLLSEEMKQFEVLARD